MKKLILCTVALMGTLLSQAGDILVLEFRNGTTVWWKSETLPQVSYANDTVFVASGQTCVSYPSRSVKKFFIDDDESGVEEITQEGSNGHILVNGRTVSFAGAGALYTTDGRKVASGVGQLRAPAPGVYLLQTKEQTLKLLLP